MQRSSEIAENSKIWKLFWIFLFHFPQGGGNKSEFYPFSFVNAIVVSVSKTKQSQAYYICILYNNMHRIDKPNRNRIYPSMAKQVKKKSGSH